MATSSPDSPHWITPLTRLELRAEIRAKQKSERNDRMVYLCGKFPELKETLQSEGQKIPTVKNRQYRVYLQNKILKKYHREKDKEKEMMANQLQTQTSSNLKQNDIGRYHLQLRHKECPGTREAGGISDAWDNVVFRNRRLDEQWQRANTYNPHQQGQQYQHHPQESLRMYNTSPLPSNYYPNEFDNIHSGTQSWSGDYTNFDALLSLKRKFSPFCIGIEDDTLVEVLEIEDIIVSGPQSLTLDNLRNMIANFFSFSITLEEAKLLHEIIFKNRF